MEITKFEVVNFSYRSDACDIIFLCIVTVKGSYQYRPRELKNEIRDYINEKKEITINSSIESETDEIKEKFQSNEKFEIKIKDKGFGGEWVEILYFDD